MEDNKNTIIAVALMLAVWIGFSIFFPPRQPVNTPPVQTSVPPEKPAAVSAAPEIGPGEGVVAPAPTPTAVGDERQIVVDHPLYRAVFTNIGARLISFELKQYHLSPKADAPPVNLVTGPPRNATITTTGTDGLQIPPDAYFAVSTDQQQLAVEPGKELSLTFATTLASGLTVEKTYRFEGDAYPINLAVSLRNRSSEMKKGSLSVTLVAPQEEGKEVSSFDFAGASTFTGGELEQLAYDKMAEETVYSQPVSWTAFGDKYFLSAIVPPADAAEKVRVSKTGNVARNAVETPALALAPGESLDFRYLLYFGPRDLDILQQIGHNLGEAVDFGLFSVIARPLLAVLKFFYGFLGNYGLAIILLTVIIKLLFWPLTQKSYASMKAMQKLQPEMQRIREKFGKDRERLNREIMELYKTHRVNPLGGCLPMLVQIPVFFALYKVLMESIEVRHAPFYLWITDLSAKDPYYITPLIMGATMFIQQKMTPTTMDPMQAKLFMLMPVIFTFMFLNFPSGLVIYWLVNNLLTIGQQYLINRRA